MSSVDAEQVSGTVGASQPGGVVGASQVGGTVGARLAQPQANLWTPAQLGSDLALWLDVWDSEFDLRTDGGTDYVERWGDLSGNGNDATQGTGSDQPVLLQDGVQTNSGHVVSPLSLTQPFSVFALLEITDLFNGKRIAGGGNHIWSLANTPRNWDLFDDGSRFSGLPVDKEYYLFDSRWDGNNSFLATAVDGKSNGSLDGTNRSSFYIGDSESFQNPANNIFQVYIAVDRALTDTERKKLQGWVAHKSDRNGIPEPPQNLPASHPYKDSPPTV